MVFNGMYARMYGWMYRMHVCLYVCGLHFLGNAFHCICLSLQQDSADCFVVAGARLFSVMSLSFAPEVGFGWAAALYFCHFLPMAALRKLIFLSCGSLGTVSHGWENAELMWGFDLFEGTIQHRWPDFRVCFWRERWGSLAANKCFECVLYLQTRQAWTSWKCMTVLNDRGGAVANNWYQRSASPKWMRCQNRFETVQRISKAVNACKL